MDKFEPKVVAARDERFTRRQIEHRVTEWWRMADLLVDAAVSTEPDLPVDAVSLMIGGRVVATVSAAEAGCLTDIEYDYDSIF